MDMKADYSQHQNLQSTITSFINTFPEDKTKEDKKYKEMLKKKKDALDFSSSKFKKLKNISIFEYVPLNFSLMLANLLNTDVNTASQITVD